MRLDLDLPGTEGCLESRKEASGIDDEVAIRGVTMYDVIEPDAPASEARQAVRHIASRISRQLTVTPISQSELDGAKQAFSTRRVDRQQVRTLITGPLRPRTGDLVLAQVQRIHYQRRIELVCGRKSTLHTGDRIIVAYGDRYATDQFEAEVPLDIGPTNLVATGGIASRMISKTAGIRSATEILPLGLLGDADGNPINLNRFAVPSVYEIEKRPMVIAVLGTSMNSGKTTINEALTSGLRHAGYRPGVAKITGTGSGGDYWSMVDAGAHVVADFTDAGYSGTYKVPLMQLEQILVDLISHVSGLGADIILIEIADGIFQEQNVDFIRSPIFHSLVDKVLFAAGEAMGAAMGVATLKDIGLPIAGVSGKLTASQLSIREAELACGVPVYSREELLDPVRARQIVESQPFRAEVANKMHHDNGNGTNLFQFDAANGRPLDDLVGRRLA